MALVNPPIEALSTESEHTTRNDDGESPVSSKLLELTPVAPVTSLVISLLTSLLALVVSLKAVLSA